MNAYVLIDHQEYGEKIVCAFQSKTSAEAEAAKRNAEVERRKKFGDEERRYSTQWRQEHPYTGRPGYTGVGTSAMPFPEWQEYLKEERAAVVVQLRELDRALSEEAETSDILRLDIDHRYQVEECEWVP